VRHVELLAEVPDDVCRLLQIDTTARVVMIHQDIVSHIFERRSFYDAAMIAWVLARGTFAPVYCGRDVVDPRLFFVAELPLAGRDKWVRIVLKHLSAKHSASSHDEIWVVTAHLVKDSTLNRMLRGSRFIIYKTTRGH
jgi:hypothetical protein